MYRNPIRNRLIGKTLQLYVKIGLLKLEENTIKFVSYMMLVGSIFFKEIIRKVSKKVFFSLPLKNPFETVSY